MRQKLNYEDVGFAKIDHHRIKRKGFPETIFGQGKTPDQTAKIAEKIYSNGQDVLITRTNKESFIAVKSILQNAEFHETAKIIAISRKKQTKKTKESICVLSAGTADLPTAEEAAVTAEFLGNTVQRIFDVGVAGIHRLMNNLKKIKKSKVVIVVAGMEGALPSVVGGLIDRPIIAVPTSVGYGSSFKGLAALLTMLNSCAPGIAVVNIDNGYGAAVMAHLILRK
ncbi:MAG: NCAIR mutase-like protein [Candidatus Saganbacteria bacterium]|uniref:NCAIR mutase-like protein n=1 Tax=Candidatus Saganbacteria bacterium TaxID=2575572 RepID=A0A833P3B6_UNCSA|nr:MAG: NCAIR mutase-like protein [Candidatus Saganbacteria bacterium]